MQPYHKLDKPRAMAARSMLAMPTTLDTQDMALGNFFYSTLIRITRSSATTGILYILGTDPFVS